MSLFLGVSPSRQLPVGLADCRDLRLLCVSSLRCFGQSQEEVRSKMAQTTDLDRFKKLLSEIRQKFSWTEFRAVIKSEDLGTATGWDLLAQRLADADSVHKARAESFLKELHGDLILGGTKDVQIFEFLPEDGPAIISAMESLKPSSLSYTSAYPLGLPESALRDLPTDHEFTAKIVHQNGDISLVFCAKRTVDEQLRYKASEVTAAVRAAFAGYEEFIALRRMDYQIYDVLTVRAKLHRIEVLVDHPDRIRLPETTDSRVLGLLGRLSTLVPLTEYIYENYRPKNLLACINNLLEAKSEGRVSKLNFRSPTDSVKKEAMTASKDLRVELYHAAGVDAVGSITPFDITVVWDRLFNVKGSVAVRVGGGVSVLNASEAYINTARISGARSDAAILAVVNKLVSYST